jgi:DNA-binding transcriptional LysR family regulator
MPLSLEALVVLDAIDRRGSFAGAAVELDRVPSAITYTVRRLEDELDVLLFDRRGRRAAPTAAGRELLAQGRRLLAEAAALEHRVQRIATGWEAELCIAVDTILPLARVWPLIARFDVACRAQRSAHTRLRIVHEVLGGTWDALVDGRANLVIGAPGDPPSGGGFRTRVLADVAMVFAVAPKHPLAHASDPLTEADIAAHRAVVAADTSRRLPPRTVGLLTGQETIVVPDLPAKLAAQLHGLGCGTLPYYLAADDIAAGRLVVKALEHPRPPMRVLAAWRERSPGHALSWWIDAIDQTDWRFLAAGPDAAIAQAAPRLRRRTTHR